MQAKNTSAHVEARAALTKQQRAASQANDTSESAHAVKAATARTHDRLSQQTFIEWTREKTEEVGKGAAADLFFVNFTQDLFKSQLLFHINGGHDYFPSYERIPHGHPNMAAGTWTDPEQIDQGLRDLQKAMASEVIEFKSALLRDSRRRSIPWPSFPRAAAVASADTPTTQRRRRPSPT